tara:strand:- start:223 stop:1083 length:861 start_codon:yes stop_codon:yes gene_type:complete
MAFAQRIIFLLFCVTVSFGQRIPQSLFEPIKMTADQEIRIQQLDTIAEKTQEQQEELALLFAATASYENSFVLLDALSDEYPDNFDYQFLLGGISGILASELPTTKSLSYVRAMKSAFEMAEQLNPNSIEVQMILLELYTELPWVLGGSNKKAKEKLEVIKSLSVIEGFLSEGFFNRSSKKNKEALVAYLNAINEVQLCGDLPVGLQQDSYYHLGVLAFYLQKDTVKAACLFSKFIEVHDNGAAYPKSFAKHYLSKISNPEKMDTEMEDILIQYDKLTSWIQNNFK